MQAISTRLEVPPISAHEHKPPAPPKPANLSLQAAFHVHSGQLHTNVSGSWVTIGNPGHTEIVVFLHGDTASKSARQIARAFNELADKIDSGH